MVKAFISERGVVTRMKLVLRSILILVILVSPSSADLLPAADREGSERFFSVAYEHFTAREYASALKNLDRSLALNTYFVDYYLMRALLLNRLGMGEEAVKSIKYYLEVRPKDSAAPRILERFLNEDLLIRGFLSGEPFGSRIVSSRKDIKRILSIGPMRTLGVLGLGKVSSISDGIFIADTLGGKIEYRLPGEEVFRTLKIEAPVTALPVGDKSFYAVTEKGEFFMLQDDEAEPELLGTIRSKPSDAALLSNRQIAVVSAVDRTVYIYSLPELEPLKRLEPAEGKRLFEPVGLAAYGGWLAVADRGNDEVEVRSLFDDDIRFTIGVAEPRDLAWSSFGDLFILSETGEVSRARISFSKRTATDMDVVLSDAQNAWSLFTWQDRVFCLDISASRVWEMFPSPVDDGLAFLSLSSPTISREENNECFILDGYLCGPFMTYLSNNSSTLSSVWNERLLGGVYSPSAGDHPGATLFFKTADEEDQEYQGRRGAATGSDLLNTLADEWDARSGQVANIVLSASTPFTYEEACRLAGFGLRNRVRIFIYADAIPSVELLRVSALTNGSVLFTTRGVWGPFPPYSSGKVRIVLPTDDSSSGFPSKSTLSVYLDVGIIPAKDWIPLWPDLL